MLFLALGLGQAFPTAWIRVHFPCPTAHESHLSSFRGTLGMVFFGKSLLIPIGLSR